MRRASRRLEQGIDRLYGDRGGSGDEGAGDQTSGPGLIRHSRAHHCNRSVAHNGWVGRCEDDDATSRDADPTGSFDDSHVLW